VILFFDFENHKAEKPPQAQTAKALLEADNAVVGCKIEAVIPETAALGNSFSWCGAREADHA
jgi:hypothetical protein